MKDEHTYGKKIVRKGRTKVIYKGTFISKQSLCYPLSVKRLTCNRRDLGSSLLHPHYGVAHTQHNKKVDEHQIAK